MSQNEIIVGLDIGTTKIAVIIGKKDSHGKIEILGSGKTESIGVLRGSVINIEKTAESILSAVKEASDTSGVTVGEVYVGIAGQHIKSLQQRGNIMRNSVDEEISQKDLDLLIENMHKLVMKPGEEIIDVIPQEFIIDNEPGIKQPIGISGICLEANFHIITGQIAAIKNIIRSVKKANLDVKDLILEPLASAEAVLEEREKEAGVVLVDIGGGTTDVAIFQDGIIRHTAVIPLGGNIITEDVKEGCSIIKSQAEALKTKFGSALASENKEEEIVAIPGLRGRQPKEISLRNLANIIQARMEEILEHVIYEIKSSGYEKKLIAGIVLTGGGAMLKHIAQLSEFMTGMDTRIGYPNEHLSSNSPEALAHPIFSTGVGLVIKGLERTEKENITSDKNKKEEKKHDKRPKPESNGRFFDKFKKFFDEDVK
ncbi:MAG: cell division protein FtsA [Bacteroidales bacterium]|jgi:cell division protein FtsA